MGVTAPAGNASVPRRRGVSGGASGSAAGAHAAGGLLTMGREGEGMNGTGDGDTPLETAAFGAEELVEALRAAFDGDDAEYRVVARQARDLADAGIVAEDRGAPLTVAEVVRNLDDAPEGSAVADRWNWWLGALDAAYGGYREFEVRAVPGEE